MPSPMDPSGIMISVSVVTDQGIEYPLWMRGNEYQEQSLFLDATSDFKDLPIVQSVEVAMTRNSISTITVELAANYDLGLALLASELFIIGNTINVEFGYPRIGLFFPRFSVMSLRPQVSINPESGLTATMNGQAGMFASTRSVNPTPWGPGMSYKDIIEAIGNLQHNRWLITFPMEQGENDPLYIERGLVQQDGSDWSSVRDMCELSGCNIVIRPRANEGGRPHLLITKESESRQAKPIITLAARSQIDMISKFPLLSLESEGELIGFGPGSDRTRTADIRSDDRSTQEHVSNQDTRVDEGETPLQTGSAGTGAEDGDENNAALRTSEDDGDDRVTYTPDSATGVTPRERNNAVNRQEQSRGGGMQANVATIGNPKVFPGDLVRLEGVGLYDGNWTVDGLNHRVAQGEWSTDYRLIRSQPFGEEYIHRAFRRSWDPNDQEPTEQTDAEGGGTVELDPYSVEDI